MTQPKIDIKFDESSVHSTIEFGPADIVGTRTLTDHLIDNLERHLDDQLSKHCAVCFFGTPAGEVMGMPLCQECFDHMWEIDTANKFIIDKIKKRPSHDWWVAKRRREVNATLLDCLYQLARRDVDSQAADSDTSHE